MNSDYKKQSIHGGIFAGVAQVGQTVLNLIGVAILARLLTPEDYGIVAMATVVIGFAGLLRDFGLSFASIQKASLSIGQQSNLFWINLAVGIALSALTTLTATWTAGFFNHENLATAIRVLSITFIVTSLGTQHKADLTRKLDFRAQACATILGAVITIIVSVAIAYQSKSFWAIIYGKLAGEAVTTAYLIGASGFKPGKYDSGESIGELLRFGLGISLYNLFNYFSRNLDNILIGRYIGSGALGIYSRGYNLMMLPIYQIRTPIIAVIFPVLSRLRTETQKFGNYYIKASSVLAVISMPISALMYACSDEVVRIMLGPDWMEVASVFRWLAIAGIIQPVTSLPTVVVSSMGLGRKYASIGVVSSVLFSSAIVIGLKWGINGVACSYAIANYLMAFPIAMWCFAGTEVKISRFLGSFMPSLFASVVAVALSLSLKNAMASDLNDWQSTIFKGALFCAVYILMQLQTSVGKWLYAESLEYIKIHLGKASKSN